MSDDKIRNTLISKLTAAKNQDTSDTDGNHVNLENEIADIHSKVSMTAINIAFAIYEGWSDKEKIEIKERKKLTLLMFGFLVVQWVTAVALIVFQGMGCLNISETIFISFFTAIIIQTIAIVLAMVAYLYKERSSSPLNILGDLISVAGQNNVKYKNTEANEPR